MRIMKAVIGPRVPP